MSTQASQDFICKAYQAGAVDYMEKPIRYNEVVTMWQHVWESSYRPQSELCNHPSPVSAAHVPLQPSTSTVVEP